MPEFQLSIDASNPLPQTGIGVIDAQHGQILAEIIKLEEANRVGRGGAILEDVIIFLADYTETHFAFEEFVMKGAEYPALAAHIGSHQAFTSRFRDLRRRFQEAAAAGEDLAPLSASAAEWLRGWLVAHVTGEDSTMARYVRREKP